MRSGWRWELVGMIRMKKKEKKRKKTPQPAFAREGCVLGVTWLWGIIIKARNPPQLAFVSEGEGGWQRPCGGETPSLK
jgi:hypothetical protein